MQQHFDLIPHPIQGGIIYQRPKDGYINATAMCQAAGQFKHYNENKTAREFLAALANAVGIPTTELVQSNQGGDPRLQGTWVHPQVAIRYWKLSELERWERAQADGKPRGRTA
jgi:hypothetical protein